MPAGVLMRHSRGLDQMVEVKMQDAERGTYLRDVKEVASPGPGGSWGCCGRWGRC